MVNRLKFTAYPPGSQNDQTYRQFQELQQYLDALEIALKPLFGGADVEPTGLLDPVIWTQLTVTDSTIPNQVGVYWGSLRLSLTGTNPNSTAQLRVTWEDEQGNESEQIGNLVTIGNNDLISITWSGVIAVGLNIKLYVRGTNCSVLGGRFNIARMGTGSG
jgi:hypothetical protein